MMASRLNSQRNAVRATIYCIKYVIENVVDSFFEEMLLSCLSPKFTAKLSDPRISRPEPTGQFKGNVKIYSKFSSKSHTGVSENELYLNNETIITTL